MTSSHITSYSTTYLDSMHKKYIHPLHVLLLFFATSTTVALYIGKPRGTTIVIRIHETVCYILPTGWLMFKVNARKYTTLQVRHISHLGKRKIIFKHALGGDKFLEGIHQPYMDPMGIITPSDSPVASSPMVLSCRAGSADFERFSWGSLTKDHEEGPHFA